jgi:hypothetical protein
VTHLAVRLKRFIEIQGWTRRDDSECNKAIRSVTVEIAKDQCRATHSLFSNHVSLPKRMPGYTKTTTNAMISSPDDDGTKMHPAEHYGNQIQ